MACLATVRPDGRPHLVPVVFATDGTDVVTAVDGKPKSGAPLARLRHLQADPRVSLLADHYEEDWARLWWIRVDGTAAIEGSGMEVGLRRLVDRYPQYRKVPLPGPLIRITPMRISGWQAATRTP